eukprot:scaffold5833_cov165-Amphora_coffeaeformis.AAC.20
MPKTVLSQSTSSATRRRLRPVCVLVVVILTTRNNVTCAQPPYGDKDEFPHNKARSVFDRLLFSATRNGHYQQYG